MAAPYAPLIKNEETQFRACLEDFSNPGNFKTSPTIATGDFKRDMGGAGFTLLSTLPSISPTGSVAVLISLSASEMNDDVITIVAVDQTSPKEWSDQSWCFVTQASNQDVNVVSIATGAITVGGFAVGAIGPTAIATGAIGAANFAIGAINATAIATGTIGPDVFVLGAIGPTTLATGIITPDKFVQGAIGPTSIATGAITAPKFAMGAIGATAVMTGAIYFGVIASGAIDTGLNTSQNTKLDEIHKRNGLDASNSLVVEFDTSGGTGTVTIGSITQNVTKVGNITTVDRQ